MKSEMISNNKHHENPGLIRDFLEKLYSNKLENIEEMDKFLDTYDHPKLNQEIINHLNRSITHNKIEAEIVFQNRKVQKLMDYQLNSNTPSKKN
jgi:hypothetical protein